MMHMTFYWGKNVTLLFDSWRTNSWSSYALTLAAVFLISAFYQYLESFRLRIKAASLLNPGPQLLVDSVESPLLPLPRRRCAARTGAAVLFGINSAVGYMLMLAVMSFNGGVFVAIVVGLTVGYAAFRSGAEEELVAAENPCACA